ncbi:Uncharacterised protein [Vibrio cholerae]|nr:Uncharacterised protein [Vibrio cholerae]
MLGGILPKSLQAFTPDEIARPWVIARSPRFNSRRVGTLNTNLRSGRRISGFTLLN